MTVRQRPVDHPCTPRKANIARAAASTAPVVAACKHLEQTASRERRCSPADDRRNPVALEVAHEQVRSGGKLGDLHRLPLLIGTNGDEGTLLVGIAKLSLMTAPLYWALLGSVFGSNVPKM